MKFTIRHTTTYTYSAPVQLGTHILRFRPRLDGNQEPRKFKLAVQPKPKVLTEFLGPEGNTIAKAWFEGETTQFRVEAHMEVETLRQNPFDYLLEPEALVLPVRYEEGLNARLQTYLQRERPAPEIERLAWEIADKVNRQTGLFLTELNQRIHREFNYMIREDGEPWPPAATLAAGRGSCRDLAVLFMDVCRAVGLAARFVSGYQHKSEIEQERRYLHAWPEVYIPGGGWRGYDPSHGLAVADEHVAVAAAAHPAKAAAIEGNFSGPPGVDSQMQVDLHIEVE